MGVLIHQPGHLFLCVGTALTVGEKQEYEAEESSLYADEPFPCHGTIELKSFDKQRHLAVLRWTQKVDAEKAARIAEKAGKEMLKKTGKKASSGEWPRKMEINDLGDVTIDSTTGWPIRVLHVKTAKTDDTTHKETTEFRKK